MDELSVRIETNILYNPPAHIHTYTHPDCVKRNDCGESNSTKSEIQIEINERMESKQAFHSRKKKNCTFVQTDRHTRIESTCIHEIMQD